MEQIPITGGCYCGLNHYSITKIPIDRLICYCSNCRQSTGSHSVSWLIVDSDSFEFVEGNPARYRTETDAWRTFCSECGTSITYQSDEDKAEGRIDVTVGSLDQPQLHPPTRRAFEDERLEWDQPVNLSQGSD